VLERKWVVWHIPAFKPHSVIRPDHATSRVVFVINRDVRLDISGMSHYARLVRQDRSICFLRFSKIFSNDFLCMQILHGRPGGAGLRYYFPKTVDYRYCTHKGTQCPPCFVFRVLPGGSWKEFFSSSGLGSSAESAFLSGTGLLRHPSTALSP
jgi:hypothetical protein